MSGELHIVILAAGRGRRMRSQLPKVLHPLAGRPLLEHVLTATDELAPAAIHVVVGAEAETIRTALGAGGGRPLHWVLQPEPLGTGHAVQLAVEGIPDDARILVAFGDVPLVDPAVLELCVREASAEQLCVITACPDDAAELGRIVRDPAGAIQRIVEFVDADAAERAIGEINTGMLSGGCGLLRSLLGELTTANRQGELYLTDVVEGAVARGSSVATVSAPEPERFAGVNDRRQLAALERYFQHQQARRLLDAGVTLADPARLDVRGTLRAGEDCFIDANVLFEGSVTLGRGVSVGPGVVIRDSVLEDEVRIEANSVIEGAHIGAGSMVGPFARLRPGSRLAERVKIGNFVETKKVFIGAGSKASHLTYLGDASLGENCNVGAGTVTCNYDGVNKHATEIGNGVFVGTNSTLVAPLVIADEAYVAAGSTITHSVEAEDLAIGRGRQRNIQGWIRPGRRPAPDAQEDD